MSSVCKHSGKGRTTNIKEFLYLRIEKRHRLNSFKLFKKQGSVSNSALETPVFDLSIIDLQPGSLVFGHSINVTMKFLFTNKNRIDCRHN